MSKITSFSLIRHNTVKSYIFDFLEIKDIFIIINLNKQSRHIIKKYQTKFIKYINFVGKLKSNDIKTLYEICKNKKLLNYLYKDGIFQEIFDYLFKEKEYKFDFFKSSDKDIFAKNKENEMILEGLKKNKKIKSIESSSLNKLEKQKKKCYFKKNIRNNKKKSILGFCNFI